MHDMQICKPRCMGRPCYLPCTGSVPQKAKGKNLLPGKRYCTGGKRIVTFRSGDPKIYVPSWCPLRKSPSEFRIYCFKNSFVWMMQRMLRRDGGSFYPSAVDYAVRYEGVTDLTAASFHRALQEKSVFELLNLTVHQDEIVEIDDGLAPYYFFFSGERPMPYVILFNGELARKNELEADDPDDEQGTNDDPGGYSEMDGIPCLERVFLEIQALHPDARPIAKEALLALRSAFRMSDALLECEAKTKSQELPDTRFRYLIHELWDPFRRSVSYGLLVKERLPEGWTTVAVIGAFSKSKASVVQLANKCTQLQLSPEQILDVIHDFLTEELIDA